MRFVVEQEQEQDQDFSDDSSWRVSKSIPVQSRSSGSHRSAATAAATSTATPQLQSISSYPDSISVAQLLLAGKFVKPISSTRATLELEAFKIKEKEWKKEKEIDISIEDVKFASGGFRDAFKGIQGRCGQKWVIKRYNEKAKTSITDVLKFNIEVHTRKQVQMHTVARELTKKFSANVPSAFGETFHYNKVYFSYFKGEPVTVEEFVPGNFSKYVNNDGKLNKLGEEARTFTRTFTLKLSV